MTSSYTWWGHALHDYPEFTGTGASTGAGVRIAWAAGRDNAVTILHDVDRIGLAQLARDAREPAESAEPDPPPANRV